MSKMYIIFFLYLNNIYKICNKKSKNELSVVLKVNNIHGESYAIV